MAFPDKEEAYREYKKAIIAYDIVIQYIRECSSALANAQMYAKNNAKKQLRENWRFAIISAIVGVILGYILNLCLY